MSTPTFTFPEPKTLVSFMTVRQTPMTVTKLEKPVSTSDTIFQGGFVIDTSFASNPFMKEELPSTIEEVYNNISRVSGQSAGNVNRNYSYNQLLEIAENLRLLTPQNRSANKSQLASIIKEYIYGIYNITDEDVAAMQKPKLTEAQKVGFASMSKSSGRGRGRGRGRGK